MTVVSCLIMLFMVVLLPAHWLGSFSGVHTVIYVKILKWIMGYKHGTVPKYFGAVHGPPGTLSILRTRTLDRFVVHSLEQ